MKFHVVRKNELVTATWKGGTTTQLFIYPEGTEYQKFNFDFRMSYATVEIPESTFTFMPGVTRHLLILRGELEIDHTGRYKKKLKKFDQDVFDGEWPTTAKGMVMDFNLMVRNGTSGMLEALTIQHGDSISFELTHQHNCTGMYVLTGNCILTQENQETDLSTGDFILLDHTNSQPVTLRCINHAEVILARVKKAVHS